jgi:hypothetical protein
MTVVFPLGRVETVTSQPLKGKAPRSFETSGDTKQTTLCHVAQYVTVGVELVGHLNTEHWQICGVTEWASQLLMSGKNEFQ